MDGSHLGFPCNFALFFFGESAQAEHLSCLGFVFSVRFGSVSYLENRFSPTSFCRMNHAGLQDFSFFCCMCFAAIDALLLTNNPVWCPSFCQFRCPPPHQEKNLLPTVNLVGGLPLFISLQQRFGKKKPGNGYETMSSLVLINPHSDRRCLGGLPSFL